MSTVDYPAYATSYGSTTASSPQHIITSTASAISTIVTSASGSSSTSPTVHTVLVGNAGYRFQPNITYANPGDVVSFVFYPSNHSVIRAAEGFPCVPYEYTYPGRTGFYSGHFLVDAGAEVGRDAFRPSTPALTLLPAAGMEPHYQYHRDCMVLLHCYRLLYPERYGRSHQPGKPHIKLSLMYAKADSGISEAFG